MIGKYPLLQPIQCQPIVSALRETDWDIFSVPPTEFDAQVRRNHEIIMGSGFSVLDDEMERIINAFTCCPYLTTRMLPKNLGKPLLNFYTAGDEYDRHVDAAFVGQDPEVRADFAVALFLSDPDTYEGGELVLEFPSGQITTLKEPQGTMVYYPAGLVNSVRPVTSGERFAFVAWVESHVQDTQKRDILVETGIACEELASKEYLSDTHIRMTNIKHNLYRQWMKIT